MTDATYYDLDSGEIILSLSTTEEDPGPFFDLNCPEGAAWVLGSYGPDEWHVIDGTVTKRPRRPGPWAVWRDGEWIDPRTPDDFAADAEKINARHWAALRVERDRLLAECDWTQVPDVPLTLLQKTAWAKYRRKLRDMPETTQDPANPVWPTKPQT